MPPRKASASKRKADPADSAVDDLKTKPGKKSKPDSSAGKRMLTKDEKNVTKPRSKSFEVTGVFNDGSETLLWSGLEQGPPRKLKFPDPDVVLQKIREHEKSD